MDHADEAYISKETLGPSCDLLKDEQPDWKFELKKDDWRSYPPKDSIELDRYWKVFDSCSMSDSSSPRLARVSLMRKETFIDFKAMTCRVGDSRPRGLRRDILDNGWLTNAYFFNTFTTVLATADATLKSGPEDVFDFRYNQEFRGMEDDGREMKRGGQVYKLPIGWKRFAVNVKGKYDDGDNAWLKEDESGWAVAYHGTAKESLPGILSTGFLIGKGQKFSRTVGVGIYCTPSIEVAQHYSESQLVGGHWVQIVLQLRVKPSAIRPVTSATAKEFEKHYWLIQDADDMRAYGVLIRELSLFDYKPPEYVLFPDDPDTHKLMKDLRKKAQAAERAEHGGSEPCCCVN